MKTSLNTLIRRAGLVFIAAALAAAVVGPALGGTQNGPPQSAINAASANWAAKAKLLDAYGQPKVILSTSSAAIDAASANWAAKAKLLNADGQPFVRGTSTTGSGLDWGDFGMGAAAMLGLLMLGSGLIAGAYYSRRASSGRRAAL